MAKRIVLFVAVNILPDPGYGGAFISLGLSSPLIVARIAALERME